MLRHERFNRADRVIRIGFWMNAFLMVIKLAAGHFGHSEAVFADGVESACDLVVMAATIVALKVGRKPFDEEHPYGHGKVESLSAILVSLIICATGLWILYDSVVRIREGDYESPQLMAVGAALVTILVKWALGRYTMGIGNQLGSPAVVAVARDHKKDAITSVATLIGVTGAYFGVEMMDPIAAGITAFFIVHLGLQGFRMSAHELMDGRPQAELMSSIAEVAAAVPGVGRVHEIRGRRSGQYIIVDMELDMDPEMTVKQSHDIVETVKRLIFERFPNVGDVMIHINPWDDPHEDLTRL
ncbi:cation diffusion facilitator family transporter [Geomesophilobacter sediminis]|uniref:Cation transporter n=1 Tax=Geomesophilobacter sediminis TaxID=2798584 RepID=A0A8J7J599_9BACT|nr:cation diffusion facilitator family transporter [Geomesophilobacter sediminis]MBJ6723566.1 cation transporter [Geomesophilobacter sediminis]